MKKSKNLKAYAQALYEAAKGLRGQELSSVIERFAALLGRHGLLKQANRIIDEFARHAKAQEGIVEIEVASSRELSVATLSHIKKAFSAQGGSASGGGQNVEAAVSVEPALLGGVVVRTRDTILDGSLRTQLGRLKMKLIM
ncbi:MAG: hypothetical protein A3H70_00905 [Candidatus Komeilibacteria bacterium RIFCSPLOWO2_02_FULL_48_11]|uniref:ATP synthase subunit delta n=1 Tax=Candidatus Komeilibacteria bacterium RIFCSPLOWO2_02_FULL_48_11 TaxID=1798553 RepID=A0A1G2BUX7_9BACT|nr:MAG: hypothetical protein A3H70_00905 [Candidatus Komeilibacteria bacterium RIFCSPLOWO2_02_FULL_48_11]